MYQERQYFINVRKDVRGLDLSHNLLPTWEIVAAITQELHQLERLSVK